MKRIRIIGLALAAVFAFGAIAASAAQAEPEFKPKGGKFPVKFTATGTKETFLETSAHGKIKCSGLTAKGELKAAREAGKIVVKFTGCKAEKFGAGECKTAGKAKEEIETTSLKAKPVFIEGKTLAKEERGLDVSPEAAGPFAKFECSSLLGTEKLTVENLTPAANSVIGRIAAAEVGVQLEKAVVKFKETAGAQEPTEYEEPAKTKHVDLLETEGMGPEPFASELSAEKAEETITYEGKETVEVS